MLPCQICLIGFLRHSVHILHFILQIYVLPCQSIDIESEIDQIDVDLSDITLLTQDIEDQLNDYSDAVQLDYTGFLDEVTI